MKKTKRHVTNVTPRQPASTHPETDPDPAMKKERYDYALHESQRRQRYREAYQSPEALAWIASMSPAQRAEAQRLGLLEPLEDAGGSAAPDFDNRDDSVGKHEPAAEDVPFDNAVKSAAERRGEVESCVPADGWFAAFRALKEGKGCTEEVQAFLMQGGNPKLRWACVCFLLGDDTCENLAKSVSMTKQAFHYHVRQLQKQIGIDMFTGQKSENARKSYKRLNSRTEHATRDSNRTDDGTSNPDEKSSRTDV